MSPLRSYPMDITPLVPVKRRKDRFGHKFLAFRARTEASGRTQERTVRVFGDDVEVMINSLKEGVKVAGRVAYDSFVGEDGRRSQTMKLVSIAL